MIADYDSLNTDPLKNSSKPNLFTEKIKVKFSIIVFIWSALMFFVNLLCNFSQETSILLFWLPILLMVGIVAYQIFSLKNNTFVLLEIFIIYLFLHLVYQVGYYGLRGSDSYVDYNLLKTIINDNHFKILPNNPGVTGWPMIHLFSSAAYEITRIDALSIAKYLPSFISSIIVLPIYLLSYIIYKEKKIALFSCLFFGFIPQFINFDALFVRETFGMFIMIFFIYILFISKRKNDNRYICLSLLLIPTLIFSHHFTCLIVLIFLIVYFIASIRIPYIYNKLLKIKIDFSDMIDIKIILLIIIISTITYWFYLKGGEWAGMFIFGTVEKLTSVIGPSDSITYSQTVGIDSPIATLTGKIIYYGFLIFHIVFASILLIKILIIKTIKKIEDISFTVIFYFCLGYGFLSLYFISSAIYPDRLLSFGWIFGTIPLIGLIIIIRKKMFKKILIILFISFIVFNIYNIESDYYTGKVIYFSEVVTEKEYLIAEKIIIPNKTMYYGYSSVIAAISDTQGISQRRGASTASMLDPHHSPSLAIINEAYFVVIRENYKIKSITQYNKINKILSYKNNNYIDKIYDLGNMYVLNGV